MNHIFLKVSDGLNVDHCALQKPGFSPGMCQIASLLLAPSSHLTDKQREAHDVVEGLLMRKKNNNLWDSYWESPPRIGI